MAETPAFNQKTLEALMRDKWNQNYREQIKAGEIKEMRLNSDAAKLAAEFLRLFVAEAVHRSNETASSMGDEVVQAKHLELILPQLLLDFN